MTSPGSAVPNGPYRGRRLPLAYLAVAHLCLFCAFAAVALAPTSVSGFYYHPRALAVVHLVTLGWITASILGALYMIVPMALGGRLPVRRADAWALAVYVVGATGMASHFWLDEPLGMAGSAVMAAAAALWVVGRAARAIQAARLPAEVKAHFHLAFVNLLLAATLGVAVAFDKLAELLPGTSLDHVVAHAHLAAIGWATMMVIAAGYRLLPMILPAAPPRGPWLWAGAALLEAGVLGLTASLYAGRGPVAPFAAVCAGGLAVFFSRVVWMLRHRRPPPATLRRPEISRLHLPAALAWLVVATGLGLAIALAPTAAWRQHAILVYGAAGLVGFLSQIVLGVAGRIVPLWIWMGEIGGRRHRQRPPSPYELADRRLQLAVLALWAAGVPLLATGLGLDHLGLVRAGGGALALAAAAGLGNLARTWSRARQLRAALAAERGAG